MKKFLFFIIAAVFTTSCSPKADRVFVNAKVYSISLDGTDFTVNLPDPLAAIQVAMTRRVLLTDENWYSRCKDVPALNPAECVSLDDIVKALTINGAFQMHCENERGSIKAGKYADFVLTDQDIFECPVTEIHNTKVVSTWFEGKKVFQNNQ